MGVIYKLREEVVQFIINQRQSNPLASCRQLAESTSQKFGLPLSKSSVHDVLKEFGIITPRGRKPKDKFEIPKEKKKQIQVSLSQVKLLSGPVEISPEIPTPGVEKVSGVEEVYEDAGRVFYNAVLWDLGILSEENIKKEDWNYYLTYSKGIKVVLENGNSFFIDLPLPLERCIREAVDGLINNVNPFMAHKVSDEGLFKACMDSQAGFKISMISIVDCKYHAIMDFNNILEFKRKFLLNNRVFVESNDNDMMGRVKAIFFSQVIDNIEIIENILNLKGFDTVNKDENEVTLLVDDIYENKSLLQGAVEKLNGMYLRDGQNRLVKVKIKTLPLPMLGRMG